MKDLIIGCFTDYDWSTVKYWANSIELCGFAGDRAVFVYGVDDATVDRLEALRFQVHPFDPVKISKGYAYGFPHQENYAHRFQVYFEYLSALGDIDQYRYVIATDVRDVVFQTDPSRWLSENLGEKKICASCESLAYPNEPWNEESLRNAYPRLYRHMLSRPIWNCGVQAGDIRVMRDFWLQLSMACAAGLEAADQAAYNVLLSLLPWSEISFFAMSEDGWACQAGTTVFPERIERFRPHLLEPEPLWDGAYSCTSAGTPHAILHQYDRVLEWCAAVQRRYALLDLSPSGTRAFRANSKDQPDDAKLRVAEPPASFDGASRSKPIYDIAVTLHNHSVAAALASIESAIAGLADEQRDPEIAPPVKAARGKVPVRIAAYLGTKDEAELIERSVAHLRAIGVDHIVACDMGSTDGTWEILERYRSADDFWLIRLDDRDPDYFETWDRMIVNQVKRTSADWAIFLDADEFWIPASGNLKECAALEATDILSVSRFNVPLRPAGPTIPDRLVPDRYGELLLLVNPIPNFHAYLIENPESPWIEGVPDRKPMARPGRIASFTTWGAHDIVVAGEEPIRRTRPTDLLIAHLPFTTRSRFARKVENIRRMFAAHDRRFGRDTAWHWRRWLELSDQGLLDREFDRTVFDDSTIADLQRREVIKSASEIFTDDMTFARVEEREPRGAI